MRSEADERPWFAAHLVSDAADFAATWAARRELAAARTAYALFMAGASPAIAAAYLAQAAGAAGDRLSAAESDGPGRLRPSA